MVRLRGFDYKSPYFYMVTLKRLKGLAAFSEIGPGGLVENAVTRAFKAAIRDFRSRWRCCEEISPFVIMPDHLHLLIKIRATPDRVALGVLVSQLSKELRRAYWQVVADDAAMGRTPPPDIFEKAWHDWIVKKEGQLAAFRRYVRENPERAALRRANAHYFRQVAPVEFLGRRWFAYGNRALLGLPVFVPFKGHRATAEGSPEWNTLVEAASRIGPGGAGVSTFMSPLEKACGNAIARAGGGLVVLSPEGFGPRWHPPREKERFCAAGRMLFLSLYEATPRQPARKELYDRCHEMIDLAQARLR